MVARRLAGEPLQYVLGSWSFRGLDLMVDHRVLIPRPETEWVVEVALEEAVRAGVRRGTRRTHDGQTTAVVADLGTGSGAIALALAAELADAEVWATDASPDALAVAAANVAGCGATRVRLAEGSWFAALPDALAGTLALVVANPPYVAAHELETLAPEVARHEPHGALVSGPTGLEAIEALLAAAPHWLAPAAAIVLEIAPHQADPAVAAARSAGLDDVRVLDDFTFRPRVLVARRG
jgi:release factor glutamine methyltransferase